MAFEQIHIVNLFRQIVAKFRVAKNIIAISETPNNVYEFILSDISDLSEGDIITIENTIGFNTEIGKISTIDNATNSIKIKYVNSIAIPSSLGTVTPNKPYFDFGYWEEQQSKMVMRSLSSIFKEQKFPLIFLHQNWRENVDKYFRLVDCDLYLFDRADHRKYQVDENDTNFETLRNYANEIVKNLYKSRYISGDDFSFELRELPRRPNNLNEIVDVISLTFSNLRLLKNCT